VDSFAAYAYSKNATTNLFASRLGYAYGPVTDESMASFSVHSYFLAILTLSTLITSPKGGKYLLEYLEKVVFFRAAVKQNYQTIHAINRYTID